MDMENWQIKKEKFYILDNGKTIVKFCQLTDFYIDYWYNIAINARCLGNRILYSLHLTPDSHKDEEGTLEGHPFIIYKYY